LVKFVAAPDVGLTLAPVWVIVGVKFPIVVSVGIVTTIIFSASFIKVVPPGILNAVMALGGFPTVKLTSKLAMVPIVTVAVWVVFIGVKLATGAIVKVAEASRPIGPSSVGVKVNF